MPGPDSPIRTGNSSLSLVELTGIEPATYSLQSYRSSQLSYSPGCRNLADCSAGSPVISALFVKQLLV